MPLGKSTVNPASIMPRPGNGHLSPAVSPIAIRHSSPTLTAGFSSSMGTVGLLLPVVTSAARTTNAAVNMATVVSPNNFVVLVAKLRTAPVGVLLPQPLPPPPPQSLHLPPLHTRQLQPSLLLSHPRHPPKLPRKHPPETRVTTPLTPHTS